MAFASKIRALHSGTARSCTKVSPMGRMNDVKHTQPKTVECECACARDDLSGDVRVSFFFQRTICFPLHVSHNRCGAISSDGALLPKRNCKAAF